MNAVPLCFGLDGENGTKLTDILRNTVRLLCKQALMKSHPNDDINVKGLLCLSSKKGDLWHVTIDDSFRTGEESNKGHPVDRSKIEHDNHKQRKYETSVAQRNRGDKYRRKLKRQRHRLNFQNNRVSQPSLPGPSSHSKSNSGLQQIVLIKKEPSDVQNLPEDVQNDHCEISMEAEESQYSGVNSDRKAASMTTPWPPTTYGQPVFPAVAPLVVAPDFSFPRTAVSSSPQHQDEDYYLKKGCQTVATAILRSEGKFATTRMIARRIGWKVADIKTVMNSLSSVPGSDNHLGVALKVGSNYSLVFFKCPPSQMSSSVLLKFGLTPEMYQLSYHKEPRPQLSHDHCCYIMKSSPYADSSSYENDDKNELIPPFQNTNADHLIEKSFILESWPQPSTVFHGCTQTNGDEDENMVVGDNHEDGKQLELEKSDRSENLAVTFTVEEDLPKTLEEITPEICKPKSDVVKPYEHIATEVHTDDKHEDKHAQYLQELENLVHSFD